MISNRAIFEWSVFTFLLTIYSFVFFTFSKYTILIYGIYYVFVMLIAVLLGHRSSRIWLGLNLLVLALLFSMQSVYLRAFNQFGLISTLFSMKNDIGFYKTSIFELIRFTDVLLLGLPILYPLSFYVSTKLKLLTFVKLKKMIIISSLSLFLVGTTLFNYLLIQSKSEWDIFSYFKTDHFIFETIPNTKQFVNRFGLLGLLVRDVTKIVIEPILQDYDSIEIEINELLDQRDKTTFNNEFSGMYNGKNLLLIEAESLMNVAIDEKLTPTLYRLKMEGININGYNSPLLFGSTSDTEFMANTSLYPSGSGYVTFHRYASNTFPTTIAKSFSELGYASLAFHNSAGDFYNRNNMLPQLGYDFFDSSRLGVPNGSLDSKALDISKWIFYELDDYFAFWISYSGHQPYSLSTLEPELIQYYNEVEQIYPDLMEREKVYLAKTMDLDRSIEWLMSDFERDGKLHDLVIIIFGDHRAKDVFVNDDDFKEFCQYKELNDVCFQTPLFIWDVSKPSLVIDKVSNPLDISPTIYDLFGIEVDRHYLMGYSVFDSNYRGFLFDENGMIRTDDYTFDTVQQIILENKNESIDVSTDAIRRFSNIQLLRKIVDVDYFAE